MTTPTPAPTPQPGTVTATATTSPPPNAPAPAWPLSSQLVPLALVGVLFAGAVLWYGHGWWPGPPPNDNGPDHLERWASRTFLTSGRGILWTLLIVVECAAWFVIVPLFGSKYPDAPSDPPLTGTNYYLRGAGRAVAYVAIFVVLICPMFYPYLFVDETLSSLSPLRFHGEKMLVLILPAALAATCVIARLREIERATPNVSKRNATQSDVETLNNANGSLRHALAALALMLSLNVFATAALLHAINPRMSEVQRATFGTEMVLAFGGAYTVIAIAFYLPVFFTLSDAQTTAARKLAVQECAAEKSTGDLVKRREAESKWGTALGLERDWVASLQAGFGLLAPMFAALVSLLLPSK